MSTQFVPCFDRNTILAAAVLLVGCVTSQGEDPELMDELDELDDPAPSSALPGAAEELSAELPPVNILPGFDLWASPVPGTADISLSWDDQGATQYEVWRSDEPYFSLGDPGSQLLGTTAVVDWVDPGVTCAGCPDRYYAVQTVDVAEQTSTTVGVHVLDVEPGHNMVPLTLVNPNITTASTLLSMAGAGFQQALYWWTPGQQWLSWWIGSPYGEWTNQLGDTPLITLNIPGSETRVLTGYVPSPGEQTVPLVVGENYVSLPLTHPDMLASEVIAAMGGGVVNAVGGWDPVLQQPMWYPADGVDFSIPSGSNLALDVAVEDIWPFPLPPVCGDGVVEGDEECDDGNLDDYDGCEPTCVRTIAESVLSNNLTCIRTVYGDVKCWGYGPYTGNQVLSNVGDDETPAAVGFADLGAPAIDIDAAYDEVCAVLDTGGIRCFGRNAIGSLGLGIGDVTVGDDEPPTAYPEIDFGNLGGASFIQVSAARGSSVCGLLDTGGVRCWGDPRGLGYGVGDPTGPFELPVTAIGDDETPAQAGYGDVPVGLPVTEIFPLELGHLVRTSTGSIRAWGTYDSIVALDPPVNIGFDPTDPTTAMVGDLPMDGIEMTNFDAGSGPACSVQGDGTLYCWGYGGGHGAIGIPGVNVVSGGFGGTPTITEVGPVDVGGPVAQVQTHGWGACAALTDGTVRCWGNANFGQTGRGNTDRIGDDETPATGAATDLGGPVASFARGVYAQHWCALLENGDFKCWGRNFAGQLGYGHTDTIGDEPGEMGVNLPAVSIF